MSEKSQLSRPESAATDVTEFFTDLDGGQFERMLSVAISQSAAAAVDNKRNAEVIIKLKIMPITGTHQVHVDHTIKFSKPTSSGKTVEESSRVTTMHVGKFGKTTLAPESQLSMFTKDSQTS